jgi:hypothetical protein
MFFCVIPEKEIRDPRPTLTVIFAKNPTQTGQGLPFKTLYECHALERVLRVLTYLRYFQEVLLREQIPAHTQTPCLTLAMLIVYVLYNFACIISTNLVETVFDEFFTCMIKGVFKNVEWGRLIGCFERSRNRGKNDVPKQQAEEGGDDSAFTMIAFVTQAFIVL